VGANDKVEKRAVELDRALGDQWLVRRGLSAGDRLIVAGLQKLKPGMPVAVLESGPRPASGRAALAAR
jgi:membrane fusion protein (multidrug efflux system)